VLPRGGVVDGGETWCCRFRVSFRVQGVRGSFRASRHWPIDGCQGRLACHTMKSTVEARPEPQHGWIMTTL
jgi:hypothetical protein